MARDKEKKEGTDEWMRSPGECGEEKGGDVGFWEKQRSIDGEKEKELRMSVKLRAWHSGQQAFKPGRWPEAVSDCRCHRVDGHWLN